MTRADRTRGLEREKALAALLYDPRGQAPGGAQDPLFASLDPIELAAVSASLRRMILGRIHRGSGGLESWFPATLAAWRSLCGASDPLDELITLFCASAPCAAWRELPAGSLGLSLEESFFLFFEEAGIGHPETREEEFLGALLRSLAVTPDASFLRPAAVRKAPGGCFAISRQGTLHAALDGRYVRGAITPLIASLLSDTPPDPSRPDLAPVRRMLVEMRLLG